MAQRRQRRGGGLGLTNATRTAARLVGVMLLALHFLLVQLLLVAGVLMDERDAAAALPVTRSTTSRLGEASAWSLQRRRRAAWHGPPPGRLFPLPSSPLLSFLFLLGGRRNEQRHAGGGVAVESKQGRRRWLARMEEQRVAAAGRSWPRARRPGVYVEAG